jgi:radical SAM protein with 4Fe4S-binding SPASM domain
MSFYELSKYKLLLNGEKCRNILAVLNGDSEWDASLPISIELHPSNKCNLQCRWCIDASIRENADFLPFPIIEKFFEDIQATKIGITIEGGGEPMLYPWFDEMIEKAASFGINLGLITNGTVPINHDLIRYFTWIRVSLDAGSPEEYRLEKKRDRFQSVLANIEEIGRLKQNTTLGVSYVLTQDNVGHIIPLLYKLDEFGVDFISIGPVEEHASICVTESQLQHLETELQDNSKFLKLHVTLNTLANSNRDDNKGLSCIAHSLRSIIHADGNVVLCEKRRHDPIVLGNIRDESFISLWNSTIRRNASRKLMDPINQQGCKPCRITKFNELFLDISRIRSKRFI